MTLTEHDAIWTWVHLSNAIQQLQLIIDYECENLPNIPLKEIIQQLHLGRKQVEKLYTIERRR
jgi:hypothetical protein